MLIKVTMIYITLMHLTDLLSKVMYTARYTVNFVSLCVNYYYY